MGLVCMPVVTGGAVLPEAIVPLGSRVKDVGPDASAL